jgi:hypothetical protein
MIRYQDLRQKWAVAQGLRRLERQQEADARATARVALYKRAESDRKARR